MAIQRAHQAVVARKNAGGGGATPAFVQDDGNSFDPFSTARSVTFTSSTTAGSMILVLYRGSDVDDVTVTDNKGGSYTQVAGSTASIGVYVAYNTAGGASHQVTVTLGSSSPNPGHIIIMEYSGIAAAAAFDQSAEQAAAFVANSSVTTGATTQASELIFGALATTVSPTAGSGFTQRMTQGTITAEDKVVAATGAQTINFTHAEATASLVGATFKGA
jgi:hypothetical protein